MRPDEIQSIPVTNAPSRPPHRKRRPPSDEPLTQKQAAILIYLADFVQENQSMPTLRDICAEFGFRSVNGAAEHIKALAAKGYVAFGVDGQSRSWRLVGCKVVLAYEPTEAGERLRMALEGEPRQAREIGDGHP